MNNELRIRLWLVGAVLLGWGSTAWSQPRQIDVKVVDHRNAPLADATVMISPFKPVDQSELASGPMAPRVFAKTDSSGAVKVDVSTHEAMAADQPLQVVAWKKGYATQTSLAHRQAVVRVRPIAKRSLQIVDAAGKPMAGLKLQHALFDEPAEDQARMAWWTDEVVTTNEFGIASLDCHWNGTLSFTIADKSGPVHRATIYGRGGFGGEELRDLATVKLTRPGKIEGRLPAQFAQDYAIQLVDDFSQENIRNWAAKARAEQKTFFDRNITLQPDGRFSVAATYPGSYWLVVYPKKPVVDSAESKPARVAPMMLNKIQVVADQTTTVEIGTLPLAKVTGRVVSDQAGSDLANLEIQIAQSIPSDLDLPSPYPRRRLTFAQATCQADGTFVCWLSPGSYVCAVPNPLWKTSKPLAIEVGAGAATVSVGELQVTPRQAAKVVWSHNYQRPESLSAVSDHRLIFAFKDKERIPCQLTDDGYGQIFMPVGAEPTSIYRETFGPDNESATAFRDRDPSANFDLELITEPRGLATNISVRGRIVDSKGSGVPDCVLNLSLAFQTGRSGEAMMSGSQLLDVIRVEPDGTFQIPPRQLLGRLTIPGRAEANEGTFTFAATLIANGEPVEVKKALQLKPSGWNVQEIDFGDIVLERPSPAVA